MPDGRVLRQFSPPSDKDLDVGGRYVLFLAYSPTTQSFPVIKGWHLSAGRVAPLAQSDKVDARQGHSLYAGMSEEAFIAAVAKIAGQQLPSQ